MLKVIRHPDSSGEPAPAFASDAEMELAEQLRHKLEERYLEASNAPSSSQVPPLSATGSTTLATTRWTSNPVLRAKLKTVFAVRSCERINPFL